MTAKKNNNASALPTTTKREQSGTKVLVAEEYVFFRPQCREIIDADTIQAKANEIRPRAQEEVIIA